MIKVGIAIMGFGTVGGGTYEVIKANGASIAKSHGVSVEVRRVLDRRTDLSLPEGVATTSISDILNDDGISIVVETIGGVGVAREFVTRCLEAGKTVVTANKELVAKHGAELLDAAKKSGAGLYFEASCMGGVPVVRVLCEGMQANNIVRFMGIFNGTTNYILTKMTEEGWSYGQALSAAQKHGYAEQDPTSDVEGFDTAYKLSILGSLALGTPVPIEEVQREGITMVTAEDISVAREMGYVIKLLALGAREGKNVQARVFPALVPKNHQLASVSGSFNAINIVGDFVGDIMLYGRGAGALPTGSAVVSDIVKAASTKRHPKHRMGAKERGVSINGDFSSAYFFRVQTEDRAGVLAKLTAVLGNHSVSVNQIEQICTEETDGKRSAQIVVLTHKTSEKNMLRTLEKIKALSFVEQFHTFLRVVD